MNEKDDEKLSKLLKASPSLKPPESFYRGVIEAIERKHAPVPWYFGYPMKGLATACVLVTLVVVTRETRRTQPQLFERSAPMPSSPAVFGGGPIDKLAGLASPPTTGEKDELKSLSDSKEVQNRLRRSISNLVENPSPFEEEDAELRAKLNKKKDAPTIPVARAEAPYVEQARDRASGVATQGSFRQDFGVGGKKQDLASPSSAPVPPLLVSHRNPRLDGPLSHSFENKVVMRGMVAANEKMVQENNNENWSGASSAITNFRTVAIKNTAEWDSMWQQHAQMFVPPPLVPIVDFDRFIVVGVFDGAKPSGGYAVKIVDVQSLPDKVVVIYREISPPEGAMTTQALTQPYHLRVIPRTTLPITFQKAS